MDANQLGGKWLNYRDGTRVGGGRRTQVNITEEPEDRNRGTQVDYGKMVPNASRICAWSVSLDIGSISLLICCLWTKDKISQASYLLETKG